MEILQSCTKPPKCKSPYLHTFLVFSHWISPHCYKLACWILHEFCKLAYFIKQSMCRAKHFFAKGIIWKVNQIKRRNTVTTTISSHEMLSMRNYCLLCYCKKYLISKRHNSGMNTMSWCNWELVWHSHLKTFAGKVIWWTWMCSLMNNRSQKQCCSYWWQVYNVTCSAGIFC